MELFYSPYLVCAVYSYGKVEEKYVLPNKSMAINLAAKLKINAAKFGIKDYQVKKL